MLAGEVDAADLVGIEFLLPEMGLGLQAKAIVRHHSTLGCGFEFQGLTRHQQAVIREWSRQTLQSAPPRENTAAARITDSPRARALTRRPVKKNSNLQRWLWPLIGLLAALLLLSWWHWQKGWKELEERVPKSTGTGLRSSTRGNSLLLQGSAVFAKRVQDDRAADAERTHRA